MNRSTSAPAGAVSPLSHEPGATAGLPRRRLLLGTLLGAVSGTFGDRAHARSAASLAAAVLRRRALARMTRKPPVKQPPVKPPPAQQPAVQQPPGKPRDVVIKRSEHPEAAAHIDHAQRQGQPSVLHIDRAGADARRRASTTSVHRETSPGPRFDRDEYPPAFTREGGANANVRFIPRGDNRGAGSSMSHQTRDLKDGDKIRVIVAD